MLLLKKTPLDLKTQGYSEKGFSRLPGLSTTAGPQMDAKAACLSFQNSIFPPPTKYIDRKPLQNRPPFLHLTTMKTASNSLNC